MYLAIKLHIEKESICSPTHIILIGYNDNILEGGGGYVHSEFFLQYYSCIGGCLVAQNTIAEIWSNAL